MLTSWLARQPLWVCVLADFVMLGVILFGILEVGEAVFTSASLGESARNSIIQAVLSSALISVWMGRLDHRRRKRGEAASAP